MIGTNSTLQTLEDSDVDRLTTHKLGSMLDYSAAMNWPLRGEEIVGMGWEEDVLKRIDTVLRMEI